MQIFKREENYKNPVNTAKRNFLALGVLELLVAVILLATGKSLFGSIVLLIISAVMFLIFFLFHKRNIWGAYLGWLIVALAIVMSIMSVINSGFSSGIIVPLILLVYVGYWNQKAMKSMKTETVKS